MILNIIMKSIALAAIALLAIGMLIYYIGDKIRDQGELIIDAMLEGWE